MTFDIVINTDNNYIQHCMAMLCSLYENNREHQITLHILEHGMAESSKKLIKELTERYDNSCQFYTVDETPLEGVQFRSKRPLNKAAYYRLMLASVLPQNLDTVLYLDCDIIVLRDLAEIFSLEIDGYALAATLDNFPYTNQHRLQLHMQADERTFCSGVMLVNLKYWRENGCEAKLLEYAHRQRKEVWLHDQDVLNYLFKKCWFLLPPKWNRVAYVHLCRKYWGYSDFDYKDFRQAPMLIHYAAMDLKPWYDAPTPFKHEYIKYLHLSKFENIRYTKLSFIRKCGILRWSFMYWLRELTLRVH